jgi:hypothetical protein
VIQAAEETTAVAFVADTGSDGIDADEKSVGIAINANVSDFQNMAAGLALFPKLVAGTGKEDHFAGALGERERFGIHETEHQDVATRFILDNGGD